MGQTFSVRYVLARLIAVTSEGPDRPLTSESQQILGLAGNVHDLAVDPAPRSGRKTAYPAIGEKIPWADGLPSRDPIGKACPRAMPNFTQRLERGQRFKRFRQ
jgi:hypothetical protein